MSTLLRQLAEGLGDDSCGPCRSCRRERCGCRPRCRRHRESCSSSARRERRSARSSCASRRGRAARGPRRVSRSPRRRAADRSASRPTSAGTSRLATSACHRSPRRGCGTDRRQPADDLGRGDEGVVAAVGHRAVPGRPGDAQAHPGEPLLGDVDGDPPTSVGADLRPATELGEHEVGADGVPVPVEQVLGAPGRLRPPRRRRRSRSSVPRGRNPSVASRRKATAIAAVELSMSIAPRPHTSVVPSSARTSSPPNGSRDQPSGLTGTTSVWPIRHSDGAAGSDPSMRATIEARPGRDSKRSTSTPAPSK